MKEAGAVLTQCSSSFSPRLFPPERELLSDISQLPCEEGEGMV